MEVQAHLHSLRQDHALPNVKGKGLVCVARVEAWEATLGCECKGQKTWAKDPKAMSVLVAPAKSKEGGHGGGELDGDRC